MSPRMCVSAYTCVRPLEFRVHPPVWVTPHPHPSIHPPHTTSRILLQSPPNIAPLTSHWPTEDFVSTATCSRLHPPLIHTLPPSLSAPLPPLPVPGKDHVTTRKVSPTSPLLSLTLSWPARCQRRSTAGCLAAFSPLRGFKGKSGASLISLEDQSSAWSKCWISIL